MNVDVSYSKAVGTCGLCHGTVYQECHPNGLSTGQPASCASCRAVVRFSSGPILAMVGPENQVKDIDAIQKARRTLIQAWLDDPDFKRGYVDNIAMVLYDFQRERERKGLGQWLEMGDKEIRDEAARRVLDWCFPPSELDPPVVPVEETAAALDAEVKAQLEQAPADPLHPTGRCTCHGEMTCEWCQRICQKCGGEGKVRVVRIGDKTHTRCSACQGSGHRFACYGCGKQYAEHVDRHSSDAAVPRMPCLGLKANFLPRVTA